jgi:hypothetical protein
VKLDSHSRTFSVVFGRSLYDVTNCRNWIPDWSFASRRSYLLSSKTKVASFNNLCTHSDFHKRNESHWVPYQVMNGVHLGYKDAPADLRCGPLLMSG